VGGAYDGLSALLVERAGFDAVWASGFSIAASKCLPDCNVLTGEELVDRVGDMTRAVSIPVIVDCDEGHGELDNTSNLARQLADCGAAGICIEDSEYPKLNSFYGAPGRSLLDFETYARKLHAIRTAAPDVVLIARTESLIAGECLESALARGRQYAEAGADFVLIHSRFTNLDQFQNLASTWKGTVPLVVIPTLAEEVSWLDLRHIGFRMVTYANQALRASVRAQERALQEIRSLSADSAAKSQLVPMEHIFRLTNLRGKTNVPTSGK